MPPLRVWITSPVLAVLVASTKWTLSSHSPRAWFVHTGLIIFVISAISNMEYRQTSDAPEPVSPVSPLISRMSFADLHFAGDWHAGETMVHQVPLSRSSPQNPVNEMSPEPTGICFHDQIAEQLRRSVSPASFTKAVSQNSRGGRSALPVVVVVVNDANVREFERRGCSCGPSSPTTPAQPSGGKCLCRLGLLLRKVSDGAKKCLPKRLSRRVSSSVATIQSGSSESRGNRALATSGLSTTLMRSHDLLQSNGGIAEPPELSDSAVFELPCPPSELAAQPDTPKAHHVVERRHHAVGNVSERDNWEPTLPFSNNSSIRPGSRWFSGSPVTTPRTSSLLSDTSTSTGGRSSLVSMPSVSAFSGPREPLSTPGSSIFDKDRVDSPVEYGEDDSDRSPWNDLMPRSSQASLDKTWSREVANPWPNLPTAAKPIASSIAHDHSFSMELMPSNHPATSHTLWQDFRSPSDHCLPSIPNPGDFHECLGLKWNPSMTPLRVVDPTQRPPSVPADESLGARPFTFPTDGVPSFFLQPPITAPGVHRNFPLPTRAFHTAKTPLTMERRPSARGAIARGPTRRTRTRPPKSAINQLPSVRGLGQYVPVQTTLRRKSRVQLGPTSCVPCRFFPDGPDSARRKKVRKHKTSDKHRRQIDQKVFEKISCPGRGEDGRLCRGRFSIGRLDNFKQHVGKCHPGQNLDDVFDVFLTSSTHDDDSTLWVHNEDDKMDWEVGSPRRSVFGMLWAADRVSDDGHPG